MFVFYPSPSRNYYQEYTKTLALAKRLLLILFYPNLTIYIIVTSGPLNTNSKKKKKYEKILFCEFKMRLIPMGIIYAACPLHRCI